MSNWDVAFHRRDSGRKKTADTSEIKKENDATPSCKDFFFFCFVVYRHQLSFSLSCSDTKNNHIHTDNLKTILQNINKEKTIWKNKTNKKEKYLTIVYFYFNYYWGIYYFLARSNHLWLRRTCKFVCILINIFDDGNDKIEVGKFT